MLTFDVISIFYRLFYSLLVCASLRQVSVEESRMAEIARLQKTLVLLTSELDNAKSIIINESNKNTMLCSQMEKFKKDKEALTKDLIRMKEIIKENMSLKVCFFVSFHSTELNFVN